MDMPEGENVFTIQTGELAGRIAEIPAIASATVSVALPDEVRVAVSERVALLAWRIGAHTYLVDGDGLLFAELGPDAPAAAAELPVVVDGRLSSMVLGIGSALDSVTLDAALRLGSLTPADVGSGARDLVLRVDDANGFTMRTRPASWTAVFGFYTPTLRTPDLVPGQVRLLRSLLAGREDGVERVILADDHSGTYIPRESQEPALTPKPAKSPRPTATPKPARSPKPTKSPTP